MESQSPLAHLWPNFAANLIGDPEGISVIFWVLMTLVFALASGFVLRHFLQYRARIKAVRSLLKDQTKETLAQNRRAILKRAGEISVGDVGPLWREFDESLVISADNSQLYNTLDAEHFFNGRTLARGLTASRLLAATPSFLVAIGVLGTFVGLTIGLVSLNVSSDEVETLKLGIDKMIQGASVAFLTSVWGVLYSLLLNLLEKVAERHALAEIGALQHEIDFLYPRIPAEQSLVHIADHTRESMTALQELHERIGDRLQETVQGMSEAMQQALSDTLNNIMKPAIDALVTQSSQQTTAVLDGLVGRFLESMGSAGRQQGELMEKAASSVNSAVANMAGQLSQLVQTIDEQQRFQRDRTEEQTARFDEQLERLSSQADERQKTLEQRFSQLMTGLGKEIETQMGAANRRDEEREASVRRLLAEAAGAQKQLLEDVTDTTRVQLQALADAGNQRHDALEKLFQRLMINLNGQLDGQMNAAEQRELSRQQRFEAQLEAVSGQQQELLSALTAGVQASQQQSLQIARQHEALMERLQQVSAAVSQSSQHLDNSSNQLGVLAVQVRQATESLGQRLEGVAAQVQSSAERNQEVASQVQAQVSALADLQRALIDTAQRSEETAKLARDGFTAMRQHQQEFLAGVRTEFTRLGEFLRREVEALEAQAQRWLEAYSTAVQDQVQDRMDKWNSVSQQYADQMLSIVNAISSIVDELEVRR